MLFPESEADFNIDPVEAEREFERSVIMAELDFQIREQREAMRGDITPSQRQLADELEGLVTTSQAFSWMGTLVRTIDGKTTHVGLHLLRRPETALEMETEAKVMVVLDELEETFPPGVFYPFITERPEFTARDFRDEVLRIYAEADNHWALAMETFFA